MTKIWEFFGKKLDPRILIFFANFGTQGISRPTYPAQAGPLLADHAGPVEAQMSKNDQANSSGNTTKDPGPIQAPGRNQLAVRQIKTASIPAALPKTSSEMTQPSFSQPLHSPYLQRQQDSVERSEDNLETATNTYANACAMYQQARNDCYSAHAHRRNALFVFKQAYDRYNQARMSFFRADIDLPAKNSSPPDCAQQPTATRFGYNLKEAQNAYVYARAIYQQAQKDCW